MVVKRPSHMHDDNFQFGEADRHIFKQQWIGQGNPEFGNKTLRVWSAKSCVKEHRYVVPLRKFKERKARRVIERMSAVRKPKLANYLPLASLPFGLKLCNRFRLAVAPVIVCRQKTIRIPLYPFRNKIIVAADHPLGNMVFVHLTDCPTQ